MYKISIMQQVEKTTCFFFNFVGFVTYSFIKMDEQNNKKNLIQNQPLIKFEIRGLRERKLISFCAWFTNTKKKLRIIH
jgi:hypothetical protein